LTRFGTDFSGRFGVYSKILVLRFSKDVAQKPVVYHLTKDFDLVFNILNATILPGKEGVMVMELSGSKKNFRDGVKFLKENGIRVQNASSEVKRVAAKCTHCGACTAVCPTGALSIKRPEMEVLFDQEKCSICELCVTACPPRAMEVRPIKDVFME
jgi:L-aspartate semialdehyde sulfurtransferase ferredoxin